MDVLIRGLFGGVLVVVFALLARMLDPKRFAGLFSAAPSIALGSLAVTVVSKGAGTAGKASLGMIFGSLAFTVYCLVILPLIRRFGSLAGSALGIVSWFAAAAIGYLLLLAAE